MAGITCNTKDMTDEQLFAALLTKDSSGNWALRTTFIDACDNNAVDCDTKDLTLSQMLRNCIGVAECGKLAIRLGSPEVKELIDA